LYFKNETVILYIKRSILSVNIDLEGLLGKGRRY
jgi:hypothetical protein